MRKTGLVILFFLVIWLSSPAQNPYIQHYTTSDGLPSNTVYMVFQDSRKFIWFATDAGVVRFDGSQYKSFQKTDGLTSNEIVRIMEDSKGRIWFFNLNGKFNYFYHNTLYNEKNAPFLRSLVGPGLFRSSWEDTDKTIYFFHNYSTDIMALDSSDRVTKYKMPSKLLPAFNTQPYEGMVVRYINRDSAGLYYLWTIAGLYSLKKFTDIPTLICDTIHVRRAIQKDAGSFFIDGGRYELTKILPSYFHYVTGQTITQRRSLPYASDMPISSALEDRLGYLWVVTFDQGVFCMKGDKVVQRFDIKQALSIIQDHENNVWISSMKEGVFRISQHVNTNSHLEKTVFNNYGISGLAPAPAGGVWCTNGRLIYLLKDGEFYTLDIKQRENFFNHLYHTKDNTLIAGEKSADFFAVINPRINHFLKRIDYDRITASPTHYKNVIFNRTEEEICTYDQLGFDILTLKDLFKTNKRKITIGERVYNAFYNNSNELILNADKNYVYRHDKLEPAQNLARFNGRIIRDHVIINSTTQLYNVEGDSIFLESNNQLYNLSAAFTSPIDLQVKQMIYHAPTLFLATARNIFVCDNPLDVMKNKSVFLRPIDISFRNINDILFNDTSLYVASDDGLSVVPARSVSPVNPSAPLPYFRSIQVNDTEIESFTHDLVIVGNSRIRFQFSGINYSSQPLIFSYKLEGADTAWTTGRIGNIMYQNLPKGTYTFRLKVRKPTSGWSEPISINFRIKATFWQQPLFYIGLLILLSALIPWIIIRRKNQLIRRREIDHQLITLEQQALQAMMNPHFIFNALGSIQNYLFQNRASEAGLYLSQFARLIRQNLSAINSAAINLEEEVDRLKNYLDLEKLRMENKFDYAIDIDESVEEESVFIPSMIIQPFVENSIWHGISALNTKGHIRIHFSMQADNALLITIEDNGIGMKQSKAYINKEENHLRIGIGMTRKRLDILGERHNVATKIEFSEPSPESSNPGTRVLIVLPIMHGA